MRYLFALFILFCMPAQLLAKTEREAVQLTAVPTELNPAKAYLLFRSSTAKSGMMKISHVFVRIPTETEIEAYNEAKQIAFNSLSQKLKEEGKGEPIPSIDDFNFEYDGPKNAFAIDMDDYLEKAAEPAFLVQVPPGTYVIYGIAVGKRALTTCNCLGTVKFEVKEGIITHLGTLYADKVHKESDVPHLEDNLGKSMFNYGFILGQALVPATSETPIPISIKPFTVVQAEFKAVPAFVEPGAGGINRLAPIPGILEYERGRVVEIETDPATQ